ncbi:DUF4164 family protein [Consotaella salsifontis]|uniref:DUF4164 family protein n=1 Tax=Consotaella salsifontis TaxID=1365950 RepID=A0A1T4T431_9HYPH|nr:DUF4164 family protein [Consotaella salsifontis]SKA35147.1 protein of unknown function [Consotaella salsifontis]
MADSAQNSLEDADRRLRLALERLESAVERRAERDAVLMNSDAELQRMAADRAKLAGQLDNALARAERLEQANREVSKRLVSVMEMIRAVLGGRKTG